MSKLTEEKCLMEREVALEEEMITRGRDRYFKNVSRCKEHDREATTSYGKSMLKRGIEPLSKAIEAFLEDARSGRAGRRHKAFDVLNRIDPEVAAFITLRKCLDTFSKRVLLQTVSIGVGRELEMENKLASLERDDKKRYQQTQHHIGKRTSRRYRRTVLRYAFGKSETIEHEETPDVELFHVGQKLVELMVQSTGLFAITLAPYAKRVAKNYDTSAYVLEPTSVCMQWHAAHLEHSAVLSPDYFPTLIPPKAWTGVFSGAYHTSIPNPLTLIKTRNKAYLAAVDARINQGEMGAVLRAINALQNTGWTINQEVHDVLLHLWEDTGGDVAGLPPHDGYRLPLCPVCGEDLTDSIAARIRHACLDTLPEEVFKAWKKRAAQVREANIAAFSKRLGIAKILTMADRYRDESAFYFPYQLDFRGRIYAVPAFLNPQGTDIAKGILQFAEGKALETAEAVKWLAIHGANTFGNDKISLDARYSWVIENQDKILATAQNPLTTSWWYEADSPFCFLAFCFEWAGYVKEGLSFKSRLPIAMDGSCNGLQIFSLLLRDKVGGSAVNLVPSDTPNDIYQIVADKVLLKLHEDATNQALNVMTRSKDGKKGMYNAYTCANILIHAGINRKTTKRQVMVLPYGGTESSCHEYTKAWLKEHAANLSLPSGQTIYGMSVYLAKLIWDAIGTTVIAARDAMHFLQQMATIANRAAKPIQWTTPCGLPVLQEYFDTTEQRIKTRVGDSIVKLSILKISEERTLNTAKQRSAISPNYIHSLDAAALMQTVNTCLDHNIAAFAMIHDSYGTYAADSAKLAALLRQTFIAMFGGDSNLLQTFSNEVLASLPLEAQTDLPPLPGFGTLDVSEVSRSKFFFA